MTAIQNPVCQMAMAIEISAAKWIVASMANSASKIRRKSLDQDDAAARFAALRVEIATARRHLHVPESARVLVAYEAGQKGFWLVRALRAREIEAESIDPVSLPVDRRARRVKTDRVDAEALTAALWRYASGDRRALRMVRVPDEASEDSREWQRERNRLEGERRGCADRIDWKRRRPSSRNRRTSWRCSTPQRRRGSMRWCDCARWDRWAHVAWRPCCSGAISATAGKWAPALAWSAPRTTAARCVRIRASAKPAIPSCARCWWRWPGCGCATNPAAPSAPGLRNAPKAAANAPGG